LRSGTGLPFVGGFDLYPKGLFRLGLCLRRLAFLARMGLHAQARLKSGTGLLFIWGFAP